LVIFINQLRMKIGVMFGSPETTTGGNALKFYSSVRLDIRRIASIKQADEVVGNRVRVKVVKNKVAAPFRLAEFDIMFNEGISTVGDMLDLGVDKGVVKKSGSWFSYGEERLGQGRESVKEFLKNNEDIRSRIEFDVKKATGMIPTDPADQVIEGAVAEDISKDENKDVAAPAKLAAKPAIKTSKKAAAQRA
jgi:recombination protein RecA